MIRVSLILAIAATLLAGCRVGPRVVRSAELPLHGHFPLSHTAYVGSDPRFHHFALQDGLSGRRVVVRRDEAEVRPTTFPVGERRSAFVESASPGLIELEGGSVNAAPAAR